MKPKTLKSAIKIITQQDRIIGELTRKLENLEDTEARRIKWLDNAKKEAGFNRMESFDNAWKTVLEKAKQYDLLRNVNGIENIK